ncbi:Tripeptidyl aminopeptidase [Paramyrothecium foliicola]|nr:Tripeptidyl aminopeptidase [Paramyrothecium foliicola]
MIFRLFLPFFLLGNGVRALPPHKSCEGPSQVRWRKCDYNTTTPLDCGTLTVPLDYSAPYSRESWELELVRLPASKRKPARGSILFNFGGPGPDAGSNLANPMLASALMANTGGEYDLVTFDVRGFQKDFTFTCFPTVKERTVFVNNNIYNAGNASDTNWGRTWAHAENFAGVCAENPDAAKKAPLMSTAFIARDMMRIVDALNEDGLLRYWGFSWGTILGATAAGMFPDRIDRLVLDSVVNPTQYYNDYDVDNWTDLDALLHTFLERCIDAPDGDCVLAPRGSNKTAKELETDLYDLKERIKFQPLHLNQMLIDDAVLKVTTRSLLYGPVTYRTLATLLHSLLTNNGTEFAKVQTLLGAGFNSGVNNDANTGISAIDKSVRAASFSEMISTLKRFTDASRWSGDVGLTWDVLLMRWPFQAKERFEGFDHPSNNNKIKTRSPVLLVNSILDPVTTIGSARNCSANFQDSVVLQHNGLGHGSINSPSICTSKAIQEYFLTGKLPALETKCDPVRHPFSAEGQPWDEVLEAIGFGDSTGGN